MSLRRRLSCLLAVAVVAAGAAVAVGLDRSTATAATLPAGFREQVVFSGLTKPTSIQFASDGRVFVAQKNGVIKVFDSLTDPAPTIFADLSAKVHDYWDRGLLGLALAPNFPADPSVYVLYTYDARPGGTAPQWNDDCLVEGNGTGGQCVVTGRLSKLTAKGDVASGTETTLINDWCQQFPSHSIGDLRFGPDGALYVSGGDGASFTVVDYGQFGNPVNPCGDPVNEGGALRSQDVRTGGDPTNLGGAIVRVDPANPGSAKIVAYGLRNPFRFTMRPGTGEIWAGDVGWDAWEEIDRVADPAGAAPNFGWPCYEGNLPQPGYAGAALPLCQSLYSGAGQTAPYFTYSHVNKIVPGEACGTGGSSITGLAFYPGSGGSYPASYGGALFFADSSRGCIWSMYKGANGLPDPATVETFVAGASDPVYLTTGPGNDLYYADLDGGTVRRIRYYPTNRPPVASFSATPTSGTSPLAVQFNAGASTDPDAGDAGALTYQWDFDSDGHYDATGVTAGVTYPADGSYTAKLLVTDPLGATDTSTVTITAGNASPTAVIDGPAGTFTWAVGNTVTFSGHATDPQQGRLPASALRWEVLLEHCTALDACHTHYLQTFDGVAGGSFVAPDHDYPSYLRLRLTATDAGGLTSVATVDLQPKTVDASFATKPAGLTVAVGSTSQKTPFTKRVIAGSSITVSAPAQAEGGTNYAFAGWSDGGAQTHTITAPAAPATYTATFAGSAPIELRVLVNGRFVAAPSAGGAPLIAASPVVGSWEQFDVVDAGDGFVALRSRANNLYVCAESGGDAPLIANRAAVNAWEKFQIIDNSDGTVSLRANANGRYVTAENGGNSPLIANRTGIGWWERFNRVSAPTTVTVTAYANNKLVAAPGAGASPLIAVSTAIGWWELYDRYDLGGGNVALLSRANNRWVTAENGGNSPLIARSDVIGEWEQFQTLDNGDGTVSLRANANGRIVVADSGGTAPLIANRSIIGAWERFTITPA